METKELYEDKQTILEFAYSRFNNEDVNLKIFKLQNLVSNGLNKEISHISNMAKMLFDDSYIRSHNYATKYDRGDFFIITGKGQEFYLDGGYRSLFINRKKEIKRSIRDRIWKYAMYCVTIASVAWGIYSKESSDKKETIIQKNAITIDSMRTAIETFEKNSTKE